MFIIMGFRGANYHPQLAARQFRNAKAKPVSRERRE